MNHEQEHSILWSGDYFRVIKRGTWEIAQRHHCSGVVGIIPITNDNEVILVEQYREPLRKNVIEFSAGLVGDESGSEHESLKKAAQRELLEETGYKAVDWTYLGNGPTSAGLTNETIHYFLATKLKQINHGGGIDNESITVHHIPFHELNSWLASQESNGKILDIKIYAGLYWLNCHFK
ncbi:ADP-ribose pyrophosphatase [Poriferisphaera corsica]|uniref:GDP-mannose pyrophosphatase n=1 Tax=Poriferisphaera corsica TaxID=2528020 RepID=A0A517YRL9_9BACT|nr:NUDIX hydrolase [Poriferisphaera corsica]QDU32860.1 ADP-ribose pyrophosphatase [Poriferisphaera corsica]